MQTSGPIADNRELASGVLGLSAVLIFLQIVDGLLTSIGVHRYGAAVEGNPLMRFVMEHLGQLTALALFKAAAILLIVMLVVFSRHMAWIPRALQAITAFYLVGAVIPWLYILFVKGA